MAAPQLLHTGASPDTDTGRRGLALTGESGSDQITTSHNTDRSGTADRHAIRSWPLLLLALSAAVAVWSGWVGIGQLTGFGQVRPLPGIWNSLHPRLRPLPGIWNSLHLDSAITLPVGVEAYALHAWLATSPPLTRRTRRFAKWSAIGSLLLGMAGQVAYHLLIQAEVTRAPWPVTTAVACLPVLILGMAAGLTHLIRADTSAAGRTRPARTDRPAGQSSGWAMSGPAGSRKLRPPRCG